MIEHLTDLDQPLPSDSVYFRLKTGSGSVYAIGFGLLCLCGGLGALSGVLTIPDVMLKAIWAAAAGMLLALALRLLSQGLRQLPLYLNRKRQRYGLILMPESLWLRLEHQVAVTMPRAAISAVRASRLNSPSSEQEDLIEIVWADGVLWADGPPDREEPLRLSSLKLLPADSRWQNIVTVSEPADQDSPLRQAFRHWAGELFEDASAATTG